MRRESAIADFNGDGNPEIAIVFDHVVNVQLNGSGLSVSPNQSRVTGALTSVLTNAGNFADNLVNARLTLTR